MCCAQITNNGAVDSGSSCGSFNTYKVSRQDHLSGYAHLQN
jgi:hypothetical protein